jgi:hypothetical protein
MGIQKMDMIFLPSRIKKILDTVIPNVSPSALMRSSGNLEGGSGEGYVIALKDKILLFSRKLGDDDFTLTELPFSDTVNMEIKKEGFASILKIDARNKSFSVKFSSFEEKDAAPIIEAFNAASKNNRDSQLPALEDTTEQPREDEIVNKSTAPSLKPITGMVAAMIYVAGSDNNLAPEEDEYIRKASLNDNSILEEAYDFYQTHSFEDLLSRVVLDKRQTLCVIANLMEVGMSDGILHKVQQEMIWRFAERFEISSEEFKNITDILLIKNQLTALL